MRLTSISSPAPQHANAPQDRDAQAIVAVRNLRFRWRPREAEVLDIAALDVCQGERVFIEGPRGSGKATLLNLIPEAMLPEQMKMR